MSHITDMLLLTNEEPKSKPILALNDWCKRHASGQLFLKLEIDKPASKPRRGLRSGGHKVFTTEVYVCAGNFFPWRELIKTLPLFGWDEYSAETTALIVQDEAVERWIAVHADGRLVANTEKAYRLGPHTAITQVEAPSSEDRVICFKGAYWSVPQGRWVSDPDDATLLRWTGLAFMLNVLRVQQPEVEAVPPPGRSQ